MSQRIVKIDRNNKSIIIRALHAVYQQRKLAGQGCSAEGALILRVNESAEGKLRLSDHNTLWYAQPSTNCGMSVSRQAAALTPLTKPCISY